MRTQCAIITSDNLIYVLLIGLHTLRMKCKACPLDYLCISLKTCFCCLRGSRALYCGMWLGEAAALLDQTAMELSKSPGSCDYG